MFIDENVIRSDNQSLVILNIIIMYIYIYIDYNVDQCH